MRKNGLLIMIGSALLFNISCISKSKEADSNKEEVRLITLNPGHFHAALIQKVSYPGVSKDVYVYAPEGEDIKEHLKKIESFNARTDSPTQWNEIVYIGPDFLEKMIAEKKGNLMITAGNNGKKTDYILATLKAGINVLSDKPMAINSKDFETLQTCFKTAQQNNLLLYDIMTERFEITTVLQKEISLIPEIYGKQEKGTPQDPSIYIKSVHYFLKEVAGSPLIRPAWFFDIEQEGEGIVDVATHLVDLIQWECFPGVIIDYNKDIKILDANHWSTPISLNEYKRVTNTKQFPDFLTKYISHDTLHIYANGDILYKIKDIHAKVSVLWNYSSKRGGDLHFSVMKGSKALLIIQPTEGMGNHPELCIKANLKVDVAKYAKKIEQAFQVIADKYPGVTLKEKEKGLWQVEIPDKYFNGHESHFEQVTEKFLDYLKNQTMPAWEIPNMIAKYYVTTKALELAKKKSVTGNE
ncbi:putative oxidoreductase C-terminal domain-containing protein [Parabacteroides sp. Marseille-P3160]|uniref:putative oxidoreductase C-terminal domain-containing protein n=1 Tax=Parabacteroides sp. Marseille-P3160 TaxID=1917887 RepID=UPI0009BB0F7E|nr:putative oxidoreductase C-terminal domain-containing protein [Parabacteroides sp. Marseille-P3160]